MSSVEEQKESPSVSSLLRKFRDLLMAGTLSTTLAKVGILAAWFAFWFVLTLWFMTTFVKAAEPPAWLQKRFPAIASHCVPHPNSQISYDVEGNATVLHDGTQSKVNKPLIVQGEEYFPFICYTPGSQNIHCVIKARGTGG